MRFVPFSIIVFFNLVGFWLITTLTILAAAHGSVLEGRVAYTDGTPVHNAGVLIVQLRREASTDSEGRYRFDNLPPGAYDVVAHSTSFTSQARLVEVPEGETRELDFVLVLTPIRESITVTASGYHETTFEAVQSVTSLDSFQLGEKMASSIGEVLEGEAGIAKRSFGPGSSRPVVRGFDGDRVLVMKDGLRSGGLASQSADHGEPIDPAGLERLEVVKGPATLLYGSNAIGGVVNAVSRHHEMHKHRHEGLRGQLSSVLGSNNGHAGASFFVEYGVRELMVWAGGGGQRTGDYETPIGEIDNSKTRLSNANVGLGWFADRGFLSFGYQLSDGRYGVPFAGQIHAHQEDDEHEEDEEGDLQAIDLDHQLHTLRFDGGLDDLGPLFESFRLTLGWADWTHKELEIFPGGLEIPGTIFENRQLVYRGTLEQRPFGRLGGSIGFWGLSRDYSAEGVEALSPPVDQNSFALYALEELRFDRVRLQIGGRLEHNRYRPKAAVIRDHHQGPGDEHGEDEENGEAVLLPERRFTGFSSGAGVRIGLWRDGAFVANYTHSYRAPALEELYNFGPHVGNLAFEIGNPDLTGERSNGIEFSLRHASERLRAEANLFYYDIDDFVFLAPTGEVEDNLIEAEFLQTDSRFRGGEVGVQFALREGLWLTTGFDSVDARLTEPDRPLPRIPPFRARLGLDLRYRGMSVRPELVAAARQDDVFETETETAGYVLVNLGASYTVPRQHFAHHFAFEVFNLGDRLYRNHLSFIKDLAPEIGRGVRLSYVVKFF